MKNLNYFMKIIFVVLAVLAIGIEKTKASPHDDCGPNVFDNPEVIVYLDVINLDPSFHGQKPNFNVTLKNVDTGAESFWTFQGDTETNLGFQDAGNYILSIKSDDVEVTPIRFYNGCGGRTYQMLRIDYSGIVNEDDIPNFSDSDLNAMMTAMYYAIEQAQPTGSGSGSTASSSMTVRVRESLSTSDSVRANVEGAVVNIGGSRAVTNSQGMAYLPRVRNGIQSLLVTKNKYETKEQAITVLPNPQSLEIAIKKVPEPVEKIYRTITFDKVGGLGMISGGYGNPICPSLTPNHCTAVAENGSYVSYTVEALPGFQFTGFSAYGPEDSHCQYLNDPTNHQVLTDLHCKVNFTAGTASPRSCLPAGTGCGLENSNGLVGYSCESCCEYSPTAPYNRLWEFGEYHYYCAGTAVSPNSATLTLSSASVAVGQSVTVNFLNTNPATTTDWIGVFPVNFPDVFYGVPTPNNQPIPYFYSSNCSNVASSPARQSGSCALQAVTPGVYEVRMFKGNHFEKIGTSPLLTVVTPPPPTVLTSSGNQSAFSNTGDVAAFTTPGLYTIAVNNPVTVLFKGSAGGGKGGESWSSSTTVGASGGAAGAVTRGTILTLVPNHNYSLVVGAGGATGAQAEGQATTLIDTTDSVILVSLGGGGGGLTGQTRGAGGIASIGSNKFDGGFGGYGGISWNSGETGVAGSLNGAAGGGGGGGYDEFGRPGGTGGSAGPGIYGSSGGSGNASFGGVGGNGAPATFTETTGNFGYGGGGAGARSGAGGNGGNGVAILVRVAQ